MRNTISGRANRRWLASVILPVAFMSAGCPPTEREEAVETTGVAEPPTYSTWQDTLNLLDSARAIDYETDPGYGDRQMLSTKIGDRLVVTGPLAAIRPVTRMIDLEDRHFAQWRTVAVIEADGDYPPLGIRVREGTNDRNFLVLRRGTGGTWEAGMLAEGFPDIVRLNIRQTTQHQPRRGPVGARWIYDPEDEHIWVRCSHGCCLVDRVAPS